MRRYSAVLVVVVLLVLSLSAVFASETDWSIYFKAASPGSAVTTAAIGTRTGGQVGIDANDQQFPSIPSGSGPFVAAYNPVVPGNPLLSSDYRPPIVPPEVVAWDLLVWVSPQFIGNSLQLSWWGGSGSFDVPDTIAGYDYNYSVEVISDPTGQNTGAKFSYDDVAGGPTAPAGILNWNILTPLMMSPVDAPTSAIKIRVTAAPVPEPSSVAVLISGLAGMVGFGVRRRK